MIGYAFPCGGCQMLAKDKYGFCCAVGQVSRDFLNTHKDRIDNGEPDTECGRFHAAKKDKGE